MALADIAQDMIIQAQRTGVSRRELPRGLCLQFNWCAGTKVLTLSRPAIKPSDKEISICLCLFDVPLEARRTDGDVSVTFRWPERAEP